MPRLSFMLYMLSRVIFASSGDVAPLGHLACMENVWEIGEYNWGSAALAVLYRSMSDRSSGVSTNHCGMSFIWEIWYYEYLGFEHPTLIDNDPSWPIMSNYHINNRCNSVDNKHDYAHARAFLACITADKVDWDPWA